MDQFKQVKGELIVSCQALEDESASFFLYYGKDGKGSL